jgi:hypothetical protein
MTCRGGGIGDDDGLDDGDDEFDDGGDTGAEKLIGTTPDGGKPLIVNDNGAPGGEIGRAGNVIGLAPFGVTADELPDNDCL